MKLLRPTLALLVLVSVAAITPAQINVNHRYRHSVTIPANPQALMAMQQDLINAIEAMKSALPIYDGDRVKSIEQAHKTLVIVDKAIAGVNAVVRTPPSVKDQVPSSTAHSKYTVQQLQTSQASMRKGLAALQQAWTDLQSAAGSNPNRQAINASNHLKSSQAEATKAIAVHAAQG